MKASGDLMQMHETAKSIQGVIMGALTALVFSGTGKPIKI